MKQPETRDRDELWNIKSSMANPNGEKMRFEAIDIAKSQSIFLEGRCQN